jgi:hypothetical protein
MNNGTENPSSVRGSIAEQWANVHLGFHRFDAENDELLAPQPLVKALLIEFVLALGEAQEALALVSDPLSRTFLPEPGKIAFEGPQGPLLQFGLMLHGHDSLLFLIGPPASPFYQEVHPNDPTR